MLQDPIVRPLHELDTCALQELLPEIPLWVKNPDYERVSIAVETYHKNVHSYLSWIRMNYFFLTGFHVLNGSGRLVK